MGVSVWYDEFSLEIGDSLSRSIDRGIANSRYGLVVVSPAFLRKAWPEYELRGLVARDVNDRGVILPIWHGVGRQEVLRFSPSLADKVALNTSGIDPNTVAIRLLQKIRPDIYSNYPVVTFERLLGQPHLAKVHDFLVSNPYVVTKALFSSGTFLCFPHFRFGNVFVCDFLVVKLWSTVTDIVLVRLESPRGRPFKRNRSCSQRLQAALRQVAESIAWITENRQSVYDSILAETARVDAPSVNGLRHRIRHSILDAKIVIGRRAMMTEQDNQLRGSLYVGSGCGIEIISYDRFVDVLHRGGYTR